MSKKTDEARSAGRREIITMIRDLAGPGWGRVCLDEGLDIWIYNDELLALAKLLEEKLK